MPRKTDLPGRQTRATDTKPSLRRAEAELLPSSPARSPTQAQRNCEENSLRQTRKPGNLSPHPIRGRGRSRNWFGEEERTRPSRLAPSRGRGAARPPQPVPVNDPPPRPDPPALNERTEADSTAPRLTSPPGAQQEGTKTGGSRKAAAPGLPSAQGRRASPPPAGLGLPRSTQRLRADTAGDEKENGTERR